MEGNFISRNGPMLKILLCGFLGLLLLIPAAMIEDLVNDRVSLKRSATNEISSKWGSSTTLAGPIITIPYSYKEEVTIDKGLGVTGVQSVVRTRYLNLLPNELSFESKMDPSVRNRGIYDVVVYLSEHSVTGNFDFENLNAIFAKRGTPDFKNATVTFGFTDSKGVENVGKLKLGDKEYVLSPGSSTRNVLPNGTSAVVDLTDLKGKIPFSTSLSIRGSEWIKYLPLGKTTSVVSVSPWPSPSFDGAFLPSERTVNEKGFSAKWKILDYNRDFPQYWDDGIYSLSYVPTGVSYAGNGNWDWFGNAPMMKSRDAYEMSSAQATTSNLWEFSFGVSLKESINTYDKTSRTVRYAILVIGLTFVSFFLMEVMHRRKIHPIQYLLVGFALVVFYTLTLSLSEHLWFDLAYGVSALLTAWLITAYVAMAFRTRALTLTIAAILSILYAFIYVILSSEDYALLLGSFGIFAVLGLLMYATRNIDWYSIGEKEAN